MASLKVLFIGGSGIISSASSRLAVERGIDLYVLNRGATQLRPLPPEATVLHADVHDPGSVRAALGDLEFDAVVDFVAFTPEHVQADIELFRGRTGQYVFISSASAYQKPPSRVPVTESTPLRNPFWQYSRDKIACEDLLTAAYRERGLPGHDRAAVAHLRPRPRSRSTAVDGARPDARAASRSSCTATAPRCGR